jgi:hypothetical protein
MSVPLSPETKRRLAIIFRPVDQAEAEFLLTEECGSNLAFLEKLNEIELERFRFAALKLCQGDLPRLYEAIQLAQQDWRDLLVAAEFANDIQAHLKWLV